MARENRKENRELAKMSAADKKPVAGEELQDIINQVEGDEDEPEFAFVEETEENEDELESESVKAAPEGSQKKGDEDKVEEEVKSDEIEGDEGTGEVADGEKPATDEPKVDEKTKTEPTVEEPAPKPEEVKEAEKPIETVSETLSDAQAAELFSNWRTTTEDLLAKHHYRLSDADVDAFNENPAEFIPRFASRVYLDSISAAFQQFVTYLPRMVDQVIEHRNMGSRNEEVFFGRWPDLKGHEDVVQRLGQAYRSTNPSASMDDFVNEVGAQAMVALRKLPNGAAAAAATNGNGQAKPFKPASNSPANAKPSLRGPTNPWDSLSSEFSSEMEEELDDN